MPQARPPELACPATLPAASGPAPRPVRQPVPSGGVRFRAACWRPGGPLNWLRRAVGDRPERACGATGSAPA
eukprot:3625103-Alexandrium_andersonii.AAC.1